MTKSHFLTFDDYVSLLARGSVIYCERANIRVSDKGDEKRFVMTGKNGSVHSLLVIATDLDRLNAHWVPFVSRNLY